MLNIFYSYTFILLKKFIYKIIINDHYINIVLKSFKDLNTVLNILKLHNQFKFTILTDIAAVDFLNLKNYRFEINYILSSLKNKSRLILTILCDEKSIIESSINIYSSSN
jgi:NADH:ubiquinone oxidoreductase subunit C